MEDSTPEPEANIGDNSSTMKQTLLPFLPPPVVRAMSALDPVLEPFLGEEASVTILMTLVVALLVWQVLQAILGSGGKGGKAIQDDEDDDVIVEDDHPYDATLLLCGPPSAGKTSLFYRLVCPPKTTEQDTSRYLRTVSSIKPNTGYVSTDKIWRYLDTPGHWGATKTVSTIFDNDSTKPDRLILVLDTTQPVNKAADYLFALWQRLSSSSWQLVVACHKCKATKAKNIRRIKLQLRNELDRMSQLESGNDKPDWDSILQTNVAFVSTSVEPTVLDELEDYLRTGALPGQ